MGQTSIYQLPWPELGATADGPSAVQSLAAATESAIARPRGWYARKAANSDVGSSTWADHATITVPSAPAGGYLITSTLYWWAGYQNMESIYTWHAIAVSGSQTIALPVAGISGPADRPWCSVLQWLHTAASTGSLTFKGQFGFSTQGIRGFANSSLSVTRVNDA